MGYCLKNEITGEKIGGFDTWEEATKASQNYGPEWIVSEDF